MAQLWKNIILFDLVVNLDQLVQHPLSSSEINGLEGRLREVVVDQRRVVLEENQDGGILGAGILAAVMDTRESSATFV